MTNTEIGILMLLMAVFWLAMLAPAIANIYWLRSENKRRKKESQKTE
jgi:putative copper export protein